MNDTLKNLLVAKWMHKRVVNAYGVEGVVVGMYNYDAIVKADMNGMCFQSPLDALFLLEDK